MIYINNSIFLLIKSEIKIFTLNPNNILLPFVNFISIQLLMN